MDFVLVFPLILALLATGQSDTEMNSCYAMCPPGYHKVGSCDDSTAKHRCEKCDGNTFTDIENYTPKCQRCDLCDHLEEEIKPCTFNRNVVCDCKQGFYYKGSGAKYCQPCPCQSPLSKEDSNKRGCDCGSCLSDPQCQRKCVGCVPSSANASTAPPATPVSTIQHTRTPGSKSPKKLTPWLLFLLVVVAFLMLFWLLVLFTEKPVRYPDSCPHFGPNKDPELHAEDPKFNEQGGHRDSSSTTMTSNTSEGTPMLNPSQSPAEPGHPAHITPLLPGAERGAVRKDEQSEQWPAIVLYTIIKEVPLRRWKEFLRLLSVADQQLERVELEAGLGQGSMERQYQMLRLWSQCSSASLSDVFSALHYMDLSGCAQLLQESLEKLQWRPELEQGFTDHGSSGSTQDT